MEPRSSDDLQKLLPPGPLLNSMGGCRVLSISPTGVPRFEFNARPEFCHTNGTIVQGGFITAWLDFSMAMATGIRTDGKMSVASLDIKVSFLERVGPGKVIVEGRVRRLGKRVAFLEATLFNEAGTELATATSTAMLIPK